MKNYLSGYNVLNVTHANESIYSGSLDSCTTLSQIELYCDLVPHDKYHDWWDRTAAA